MFWVVKVSFLISKLLISSFVFKLDLINPIFINTLTKSELKEALFSCFK